MAKIRLLLGDCVQRMGDLPEFSVDAVVCDPPYFLHFMGKKWDAIIPGDELEGGYMNVDTAYDLWFKSIYRVLKPGGIVKAFSGTRTFHRMTVAMERANLIDLHLEGWAYGSGFPKSLNVSKAIDAMKGAKRGTKKVPFTGNALMRSGGQNTRPWMEEALAKGYHEMPDDESVTDEAKLWLGWGSAQKPAWEPILVGRKPIRAV